MIILQWIILDTCGGYQKQACDYRYADDMAPLSWILKNLPVAWLNSLSENLIDDNRCGFHLTTYQSKLAGLLLDAHEEISSSENTK